MAELLRRALEASLRVGMDREFARVAADELGRVPANAEQRELWRQLGDKQVHALMLVGLIYNWMGKLDRAASVFARGQAIADVYPSLVDREDLCRGGRLVIRVPRALASRARGSASLSPQR